MTRPWISPTWQIVSTVRDILFSPERKKAAQAMKESRSTETTCWCHKCNADRKVGDWPYSMTVMILCPDCGCKRCPKASDHELDCTDSNDPGQPGSVYE